MRRRTVRWLVLVGVLTACAAWADLAPIPRPPTERQGPRVTYWKPRLIVTPRRGLRSSRQPARGPGPQPVERAIPRPTPTPTARSQPSPPPAPAAGPPPAIRMQSATITAELRMASATDLEKLPKRAAKGAAAGQQWVAADVTCEFELFCKRAARAGAEFWMAFPVHARGDPDCWVTRFIVEMDGKRATRVLTLDAWRPDAPGRKSVYNGYQWPTTATEGAAQRVKISYGLLLPVERDGATFRYVLRSGGMWSEPIGQETVTIRAAEPLRLRPAGAGTIMPAERKAGSWVWKLKKTRPSEDIVVGVELPPAEEAASAGKP